MPYRVSSIYGRLYFPVLAAAGSVLIVQMIFSDRGGKRPGNVVLMSILMAWLIAFGVRGWRSGTLLAFEDKVKVRGLIVTMSWPWQEIGRFVTDTRRVRWMGLPIRVRRRVLGVELRGGQTRWLTEITRRTTGAGTAWIDARAARLNEFLAVHSPRQGNVLDQS